RPLRWTFGSATVAANDPISAPARGPFCTNGRMEGSSTGSTPVSHRADGSWPSVLRRILAVIRLQFVVQFRVLPFHLDRLLEEALGRHGEELGGVGRPVAIEYALLALSTGVAKLLVLSPQHPCPGDVVAPAVEDRRPVGHSVLLVQLVRKFVQ